MSLQKIPKDNLTGIYDLLDTFSLSRVSQTSKQMKAFTVDLLKKRKIQTWRKKIVEYTMSSLSKNEFETGLSGEEEFHKEPRPYIDFRSYEEFTKFQISTVENATDEELFLYILIIDKVIPRSEILSDELVYSNTGFVFGGNGKIVFTSKY